MASLHSKPLLQNFRHSKNFLRAFTHQLAFLLIDNVAILVWVDQVGKIPQSIRQILVSEDIRKLSYNLTALDYLLLEEHGIYICEAYSPQQRADGSLEQAHYKGEGQKQRQQRPKKSEDLKKSSVTSSEKAKKFMSISGQDARFQSSAALVNLKKSGAAKPSGDTHVKKTVRFEVSDSEKEDSSSGAEK